MKLNNKGFMLAEVTIVSALAATVMVVMYASCSRLIDAYETREYYYDADTIYALGYVYDYLIDNNLMGKYINEFYVVQLDGNTRISTYISDSDISNNCLYVTGLFSKLKNSYNINSLYLVSYDALDEFIDAVTESGNFNNTFKDYLNNYVKDNVNENSYILVIERKVSENSNNYYYYYIEV